MNFNPCDPVATRGTLLACAIFSLLLAAGCGAGQEPTSETSSERATGPATARVVLQENGTRVFTEVSGPLADYPYYQVMPENWPAAEGPKPVLAVGQIVQHDDGPRPIQWASRQLNPATTTVAVGAREIPDMSDSKRLARISNVTDSRIRFDKGLTSGVSQGDLYFILNRGVDEGSETRFGQRIGALLDVTEVGEEYAIATLRHADIDPAEGDVVVFAQVQTTDSIPSATLAFAPISGTDASEEQELPAIAATLPDYLSEYLISNVAIETLSEPIDPRPWNAPERALKDAPENAFGTLIFGAIDTETDEFIYNATYFGDAPHPANTVGILPGGLRIPMENGPDELSSQLVPSFVATALAQRNEHAAAIYLLESALRGREFSEQVRYHLREHLALRYQSIDRSDDAIRLMTDDIEEAAQTDNVLAELNARSIRAFLDSEVGAVDAWIEDTEKFLELADGVLPSDALFYERLAVARALRAGDELDDAKSIVMNVLDEAQSRNDKDLIYAALFQLALTELDHDQPESALLVLADLEDMSDQLSDKERAELNSVAGVLYAEAGKPREAANRIVESLRIVQELNDASLRARISVRAASALITTGRSLESIQYLQSAVVGYTESYQFDEAAETLARLAYQELTVANESAGQDSSGPQLVALAREHLANASESLVVLGRDLEAASQFFALGVLEFRIGNYDGARIFLDRAREFSLRSADYEALAAIAQQRAELASEAGDTLAEQQYREESAMWMEAAGIEESEVPDQVEPQTTVPPSAEEAAE